MRKKNAVTHISVCNKKDRFYFARDNKKTVWQVVEQTSKRIRGEMRSVSICKNDLGEKRTFMAYRMIIFLGNQFENGINKIKIPEQSRINI